ncbi:hypothetical protein X975_24777, partial [Stegodyphus mimosarum]
MRTGKEHHGVSLRNCLRNISTRRRKINSQIKNSRLVHETF